MTANTPWEPQMGDVPMHLEYFEGTMFEMLEQRAATCPDAAALLFLGRITTCRSLVETIKCCAKSLKAMGIRAGDSVTIALPNCPQAVCLFYAVNLAGGICNMIHPLSAEQEIEFYLRESRSVAAVTLEQFYHKFSHVRQNTCLTHLILTRIADSLPFHLRLGSRLTQNRQTAKVPGDAPVLRWQAFLRLGRCCTDCKVLRTARDPAVILFSGGTTGTNKGIVLTNRNFNALSAQVAAANPMFRPGDRMLAAMPMFHGFGLGICIHTMLTQGGSCLLVPRFTPKSLARDLVKHRCHYIAGVPTLFEALLQVPDLDGADLGCLKGVFSGGDALPLELGRRVDQFLRDHHAAVRIREGYGTTETVTACCLMPPHLSKEGSVGLPFSDTFIKIVRPGTDEPLPYGTEGEILLAGPTVMKEYLHQPEETARTLRTHADGLTWVYTGDLGVMDERGFLSFKGRIKRMIVTSGYNVYPAQIEHILDSHQFVRMSCVIGIPDPQRIQAVKAFVQLVPGIPADEQTRQILLSHCRRHIAAYAMPRTLVFREELPKTPVGKVAYRVLEEEAIREQQP